MGMGTIAKDEAWDARLPLLPLWEKVSPQATDEGCSSGVRRWRSLEHPSSVSALSRRSTFPHKGGRKGRVAAFAETEQSL